MAKLRRLTKARLDALAIELLTYLQRQDLFRYIHIYVNGQCYTSERHDSCTETRTTQYGKYFVIPNINAKEMMTYCNPDTISVTFDGDMYYFMNEPDNPIRQHIEDMFRTNGMYIDQGYPYDFSAYYDD